MGRGVFSEIRKLLRDIRGLNRVKKSGSRAEEATKEGIEESIEESVEESVEESIEEGIEESVEEGNNYHQEIDLGSMVTTTLIVRIVKVYSRLVPIEWLLFRANLGIEPRLKLIREDLGEVNKAGYGCHEIEKAELEVNELIARYQGSTIGGKKLIEDKFEEMVTLTLRGSINDYKIRKEGIIKLPYKKLMEEITYKGIAQHEDVSEILGVTERSYNIKNKEDALDSYIEVLSRVIGNSKSKKFVSMSKRLHEEVKHIQGVQYKEYEELGAVMVNSGRYLITITNILKVEDTKRGEVIIREDLQGVGVNDIKQVVELIKE